MALHDNAVEPEEDRAIVIVGIELNAQQVQRRLGKQEARLRSEAGGEGAAQQIGDEARRALHRLERDVARKAVGDDDVGLAAAESVALDEAVERQGQMAGGAQPGGGVLDLVGALHLLGADVEQAHPRPVDAVLDAGIGRAHDRVQIVLQLVE